MAIEKNNQSKDLYSSQVDIQTKRFFFDIKENHKGRYLRITEQSGGRSSIVVPIDWLDEFENQIKLVVSKSFDWRFIIWALFRAVNYFFPV